MISLFNKWNASLKFENSHGCIYYIFKNKTKLREKPHESEVATQHFAYRWHECKQDKR